ncbi:hypothetical protein PPL_05492 [Heterostelium album PN500]|uniref:Uncharacterized protein n=1 Tax=Heterostelium pallidum (strain ATCC 26659 / Pp 5 / PN500) TaxID=670386 RepID=D3BAB6_HETP5|nr:hypothetical protein PPL_05492 [Heterostelium album PN500]EFA81503.1 hypothetical protein PPL_05492 [Heterostelium album PN500]|eukprot:XP_020433620.1 hypothetical protein PPL_05492 [Heterostelium album PN500]
MRNQIITIIFSLYLLLIFIAKNNVYAIDATNNNNNNFSELSTLSSTSYINNGTYTITQSGSTKIELNLSIYVIYLFPSIKNITINNTECTTIATKDRQISCYLSNQTSLNEDIYQVLIFNETNQIINENVKFQRKVPYISSVFSNIDERLTYVIGNFTNQTYISACGYYEFISLNSTTIVIRIESSAGDQCYVYVRDGASDKFYFTSTYSYHNRRAGDGEGAALGRALAIIVIISIVSVVVFIIIVVIIVVFTVRYCKRKRSHPKNYIAVNE